MGSIAAGNYCDIVSLDKHHPLLVGKKDDDWLNAWIFSGDKSCISDVWTSGKHVVKNGRHIKRDEALASFTRTMKHLMD